MGRWRGAASSSPFPSPATLHAQGPGKKKIKKSVLKLNSSPRTFSFVPLCSWKGFVPALIAPDLLFSLE